MGYQIIEKKRFQNKLFKLLEYLEKEWGHKVAANFFADIKFHLNLLSNQPYVGKLGETKKNVRSVLITKHNRVYYRVEGNTIEVLNMYDTRMNPKKNKYR